MSSSSFIIKADYRERSKFEGLFKEVEWVNLHVGDFMLVDQNGATFCILERKTVADLASSICDGRYKEQKARLYASGAPHLGYIIEGCVDMKAITFEKLDIPMTTTVKTIIVRLQLSDNMACFNTSNVEETAALISHIAQLAPKMSKSQCTTLRYSDVLHVKKADNVTPKLVAVKALMGIPRVSSRIAEAILDEFNADTMSCLITTMSTMPIDAIVKKVADLKPNGTKRLGTILANSVTSSLGLL